MKSADSCHSLKELVRDLAHGRVRGCLHAQGERMDFQSLGTAALERAAEIAPLRGQRLVLTAAPTLFFVKRLLACWQAGVLPLVLDDWTVEHAGPGWLAGLGAAAIWRAGPRHPLDPAPGPRWPQIVDSGPDAPALVLFTSGSSGQPKGVVLSHRGLCAQLSAVAAGMDLAAPAPVGVILPLHHAFALITQVLLTLRSGGDLHLLPGHWLPAQRLAYLQTHAIARLAGVPTQFRLLMDDGVQLPALSHLTVAGAALDPALAERILAACPNATLWVGYGLTEAGPRVCAIHHHDPHFTGAAGRPLPDTKLRIVRGEIQVQSPALMTGYLDLPGASAAAFADGWLRTGDLGELRDGCLYVTGRKDEVFLVAGEKVAPLEVEKALLGCPGVTAAAVYGEPDPVTGSQIVALIQGEASLSGLRQHARAHLPPEKRPRSWYAVESLPLTPNGKLKRKELASWPKQAFTPGF